MKVIFKNTSLEFQTHREVQYQTYEARTDKGGYITNEGSIHLYALPSESSSAGPITNYIPVTGGMRCKFFGKYMPGTFSVVWGYSDQQGSDPQALLAAGDYTNGEFFDIPATGVNYIIGWSGKTYDVELQVKVPIDV